MYSFKGLDNFGLWTMSIHHSIEVKTEEVECRVVAAPGSPGWRWYRGAPGGQCPANIVQGVQ